MLTKTVVAGLVVAAVGWHPILRVRVRVVVVVVVVGLQARRRSQICAGAVSVVDAWCWTYLMGPSRWITSGTPTVRRRIGQRCQAGRPSSPILKI
jgi:hypothetical protein